MGGEIKLEQAHSLGLEAVRQRADQVATSLQERFGVVVTWEGNTARISGKGVAGTLDLTADKLVLTLKLGLMMRPLAGKIQAAIERQIGRALGTGTP